MRLFIVLSFLFIVSCTKDNQLATTSKSIKTEKEKIEVNTISLEFEDFTKEKVYDGVIGSQHKYEMYFKSSEQIAKIHQKNGDFVAKGEVIATLKNKENILKVEKAKIALQKSQIEFKTLLVGQGYNIEELEKIPQEYIDNAKIKAGYSSADIDFKQETYKLKQTKIIAPSNGIVSNISLKEGQYSKTDEAFCHILEKTHFIVTASIFENEMKDLKINDKAMIKPLFSHQNFKGTLYSINPEVNEDGLIRIEIKVPYQKGIIEGGHVTVTLKSSTKNQFIIPKEALLERLDKHFIFRVQDNKAEWVYVKILGENSMVYAIENQLGPKQKPLQKGDLIITGNHYNLAHGTEISTRKKG